MKKLLVIVLALVMLFSFAACDKTTQPDATENDSTESEVTKAPAEKEEPVELKWYVIGSQEQPDQDMVEEKINEYTLEKLNCTVDIIFIDYGDYPDVVGTNLATGEAIDLCFTSSWTGAAGYRVNAPIGNFVELNDYLAPGGALAETMEIIGADFMNATQINGKNYAVPCNKEQAHNWGFLFRKDIVEELSLDIDSVKTVEDLEPILAAVKEAYPDMIPLVTATGEAPYRLLDWNTFISDSIPGALYPDNRDNVVVNQFEMPETIEHFKTMKRFYDLGYIRADADTYTAWKSDLESGLGFCVSQSMKPGKDVEFSQGLDYEFIQVDCTEPVMSNREADGSMMAIPIGSKHPDKAAELMNLANTDKYFNNLLNFGIEDYHFTKVSDNVIELSEDNTGWRPNITWVFPNQFMNYTMSSEDPDKFVNFIAYNQSSLPLNNLGFVYDGSDMENITSALQAITDQYTTRLFCGAVDDVDALVAEMNEKMYTAGLQDLLDDIQAQYDAWLEAK